MQTITSRFIDFYETCRRQEAEFYFDVTIRHFKYLRASGKVYECNEEEFDQLVALCREVSKINPAAINLVAEISFADSAEKRIGRHDFDGAMLLNYGQLSELVTRCMPPTDAERANQDT